MVLDEVPFEGRKVHPGVPAGEEGGGHVAGCLSGGHLRFRGIGIPYLTAGRATGRMGPERLRLGLGQETGLLECHPAPESCVFAQPIHHVLSPGSSSRERARSSITIRRTVSTHRDQAFRIASWLRSSEAATDFQSISAK